MWDPYDFFRSRFIQKYWIRILPSTQFFLHAVPVYCRSKMKKNSLKYANGILLIQNKILHLPIAESDWNLKPKSQFKKIVLKSYFETKFCFIIQDPESSTWQVGLAFCFTSFKTTADSSLNIFCVLTADSDLFVICIKPCGSDENYGIEPGLTGYCFH